MKVSLPLREEDILKIKAGDEVLLSGKLYVGRDQVHKKLKEMIEKNETLPFEFENNAIYYMGPSPAPEGFVIGASGPTTSARMDPFSPLLIKNGLRIMIGKGPRNDEVKRAILEYKGVYFQAYGGCGSLYASKIKKKRVIAFEDLGPEALLELEIEDFPVICVLDSSGGDLTKDL